MEIENFNRLYHKHYGEICRFCAAIVNNNKEAEDITNQAFVKAYYHFDLDKKTSFRTFIFKIAKNLCHDYFKSRRYHENDRTDTIATDQYVDDSLVTNGALLHQELMTVLYQCLDKLEHEQKLCIRFHFIEQFTYREIADISECSISTVKNRIESGLKNLKKCLRENSIIDS